MLKQFEAFLANYLETSGESKTKDAMAYSLLGGGKRLRPSLLFALSQDLNSPSEANFECGAAIEMIHTYSLIHDDLPAMDNDDYRRHKLTNHKVFGEGQAILAGDALLTAAFEIVSDSEYLDSNQKIGVIKALSKNAGSKGMILGQELDTEDAMSTLEQLNACYELKTGCLFSASLEMATIISGRTDLQLIASKLGINLGLAFQYQDDILEATTQFDTLGKSSESDLNREKTTIVSLLGLEQAQRATDLVFESMLALLSEMDLKGTTLRELIESMTQRTF